MYAYSVSVCWSYTQTALFQRNSFLNVNEQCATIYVCVMSEKCVQKKMQCSSWTNARCTGNFCIS